MDNTLLEGIKAQGFDRSDWEGAPDDVCENDGVRVKCSQCEALVINGIPTHETRCPNQTHECKGCGENVPRKGSYCPECA